MPDLSSLFRVKAAREVVDATLRGEAVQDRELDLQGRSLLVNSRPLPTGGAVLVLHDVSELRRLETVRRDFVANVSHELKTPLTSISGYAETLLSENPDEDTRRIFLRTILTNAQRIQSLVDDQLDLSRIESGRWQPQVELLDAATVARDAWQPRADRAKAARVGLQDRCGSGCDRDPGRPGGDAADPGQPLRQRAPVHATGRQHHLREPAGGWRGRGLGARHRHRHRLRAPAADLRALLSRGRRADA